MPTQLTYVNIVVQRREKNEAVTHQNEQIECYKNKHYEHCRIQ